MKSAPPKPPISRPAILDRLYYHLTNIPNRRYFDEICAAMSETTKNLLQLRICKIDID